MKITPDIEAYLRKDIAFERKIAIFYASVQALLAWFLVLRPLCQLMWADVLDTETIIWTFIAVTPWACLLLAIWWRGPRVKKFTFQPATLIRAKGIYREELGRRGRILSFFKDEAVPTPANHIKPECGAGNSTLVEAILYPAPSYNWHTWRFDKFRIISIDGNHAWQKSHATEN